MDHPPDYEIIIDVHKSSDALGFISPKRGIIAFGCKNVYRPVLPNELSDCWVNYKSLNELYEKEIEAMLTHEYIHLVLRNIDERFGEKSAYRQFDNIDKNRLITKFDFYVPHPFFDKC